MGKAFLWRRERSVASEATRGKLAEHFSTVHICRKMATTDQDELARQLRACVSAAQCVNVLREQVQREVRHRPNELWGWREPKVIQVVKLFEDSPTGPYCVMSLNDGSYKIVNVLQNEVMRVASLATMTVPSHTSAQHQPAHQLSSWPHYHRSDSNNDS